MGNFEPQYLPLPHANCMCSQYQVLTQSLDDCAKELRAWLDGEPNLKLDNAFGNRMHENLDNIDENVIINIVAADGMLVQSFSSHAIFEQMDSRGVTRDDVADALMNPLYIRPPKYDKYGRPSQQYIGYKATVAADPENGVIATVWPTGESRRKASMRRKQML